MSLIFYLSLDTWSHIMLTHISPHSIEPQCCFHFSYCLSERVFSVVLYCQQTILICLWILYAFIEANKSHTHTYGWRRGVVVSGVRRMNEVNARRARLVPGWVTVFGRVGYTISVCNKPTRSTQPCIPPGLLSRVPALAGVRARMSPLPGGR